MVAVWGFKLSERKCLQKCRRKRATAEPEGVLMYIHVYVVEREGNRRKGELEVS
jgi:hypothetical protein